MASRYPGSRYDGDGRRSRSRERDRSPDRFNDRVSQYSDGGPRRSSAESRSNSSAFPGNRDSFRDPLPRDPPRGPKALIDAPSGPRGGGYGGEFRGGRGRGRGRGWRDDSRDRGRDRDLDFRDRRDSSYRDERSRERDRGDWRDRDRDNFRGRRPSPRGRSPPGRDFRDARDIRDHRDPPLGVDADRARRGSRDGPLSAGSSSSDPPFGPSYRGGAGFRGRGGRGRGDWDRTRGRAGFYDERDRPYGPGLRSRSQESRYRDRDDRDRERYPEGDLRPRDPRDDRDARERDARAKLDRTSHEPPSSTKDVSPPPVAPAAPSFGSVPNRTSSVADISPLTGKAPPTGPRALKDERPPATPGVTAENRAPPTGPSKSSIPEGSPQIPSGPRLQRPAGPSSKQWINPNLKRGPESPKMNRSQSFAQPRSGEGHPDGTSSEQGEMDRRPRSSDPKSGSRDASADGEFHESNAADAERARFDRRPRSAGSSIEHDFKFKDSLRSAKRPDSSYSGDALEEGEYKASEEGTDVGPDSTLSETKSLRGFVLPARLSEVKLPQKQANPSILDHSSESDDEEFGDMLASDMAEAEDKLQKLQGVEDGVPISAIVRHARISLDSMAMIVAEPEKLTAMVGPIPDGLAIPEKKSVSPKPQITERGTSIVETKIEDDDSRKLPAASPVVTKSPAVPGPSNAELPQPSIEQDIEMPNAEEQTSRPQPEDTDTVMEDTTEPSKPEPTLLPSVEQANGGLSPGSRKTPLLTGEDETRAADDSKRPTATPTPEDIDEETEDEVDLQTIEIVREHMTTPPLDSLPVFDEKPWFEDNTFLKSMATPKSGLEKFMLVKLEEEKRQKASEADMLRREYARDYESYLRFTLSNDPVAVKSRDKFMVASGIELPAQKPIVIPEPKPESTSHRRSRYASERDLERVLEESRIAEAEKKAAEERAEKERYRSEKEAVLPIQYQSLTEMEDDFYRDSTGFVQAEKLVAAWEVLEPVNNFTEEEASIFEKAYLEFPKQWGKVADPLPERDFGTCIQFYYLKKEKEELNLKEKLKKRPRQRKKGGRGKQRSSALVSELGIGENDGENTEDTGENGERRRPRRAAAPNFNNHSETPAATDGEGTPVGTPGRRGARGGDGAEKPRRGRRAKEKEPKQPRVAQTLAAAPPAAKPSRSRSSSRAQVADWQLQQGQSEPSGAQPFDMPANTGVPVPPAGMQPAYPPNQTVLNPDRPIPPPPAGSITEVMAPPPLRPDPPQPQVPFDLVPPSMSDRKSGQQASSYWSVPEANDFPNLLRSFGSDWGAIANHMKTKTAVMVKNYYVRQKDNGKDWEALVAEADAKRARGEKRPAPPAPTAGTKKRYDPASLSRPLAAADAVNEDGSPIKVDQPLPQQSMTGRFNVPIAAQPQGSVVQPPFSQTNPPPGLVSAQGAPQPGQPSTQPVTQAMSPGNRPLRAPFAYPERDREQVLQPPGRVPAGHKPGQAQPVSDPSLRHSMPEGVIDERQKMDLKPSKDSGRPQDRQSLLVKQEPDMGNPYDPYAGPGSLRGSAPPRAPEAARAGGPAPQAPFAAILQQQPGRVLLGENKPSTPVGRPMSNLSRPISGPAEGFSVPPPQHTPPAAASAPPRQPERKTSNLMALLNDDPPPPPKRVIEVPPTSKPSSTPPNANLSRPPPAPPPAPPHLRRDVPMADPQGYPQFGRNPPPAPSSMPSLKPYTASPQAQPLSAPRHVAMDDRADRDFYGQRQYSSPHQQPPPAASSPPSSHAYPPGNQASRMPYQTPAPYPYGGQAPPPSSSPPPGQYAGHSSAARGHDPSPQSNREAAWPAPHQGHAIPPQQQQPSWAAHPSQPKSTQPPPAQSPWAAQHASTPKPPSTSSSVPPPSWQNAPLPRGHDPMALRDPYPPHRPMQPAYAPASREQPPPQAPAYARYSNTPAPPQGRDLRDPGPPRSYTPGGYPPNPDMRDVQLREQQAQQQQQQQQQPPSLLQQQLRPQDRGPYDRPPDRYGR